MTVKVTLQDINDHVPIFDEKFYTVTVTEVVTVNSTILTIKVSGKDENVLILNKQTNKQTNKLINRIFINVSM